MNFEGFIRSGKVRKGMPDVQHAKSLVKMSDTHLGFLKSQKIDETSASSLFHMHENLRLIEG